MTATITRATEAITANLALAALTRIGVPILLALVTWLGAAILDMREKISTLQGSFAAAAARVERLETRDEAATRQDAETRAAIASLVATQAATLRSVERIERTLERAPTR